MNEPTTLPYAPVVMLRWFPEGAGYAYDSTIEAGRLSVSSDLLGKVFQTQPAGSRFSLPLTCGGWLLGDKIADAACLDDKAAGREPAIVRAVLLPERPKPQRETSLLHKLQALPLPTSPGPTRLGVPIPSLASVQLPPPTHVVPPLFLQWGPWAAALGVLLLEAYIQQDAGLAQSPFAWIARVIALLVAVGLYFVLMPPQASSEEIREREYRLQRLDEDEASSVLQEVFAPEARLVGPDGQGIRSELATSESQYLYFACSPGLTVLAGKERLRWGKHTETVCWFVRHYRRTQRRWQIVFAQWTPVHSRSGENTR